MATRKNTAKVKRAPTRKRNQPAKTSKRGEQAEAEKPSMSEQLKAARERYTKSKSATGTASAHNGDELATLLAGSTPEVVCAVAEKVAGMKAGELAKQYGHLNPGQVRMCSGNRIRAMVKKEAVSVDDVAKALAAL